MEVVVVGAGISGLLTALELAGNRRVSRITVFERRALELIPRKHCSGLVSRSTATRIPYARRFVENTYSAVSICTPLGIEVELVFDSGSICKIDRVAHERLLLNTLMDRGIDVRAGSSVLSVERRGRSFVARLENGLEQVCNAVVVAEGYPPRLAKALGLKARVEALKGIQHDVRLGKRLSEHSLSGLHVYLGRNAFAWFIPVTERKAVIGVATERKAIALVGTFTRFFEKKLGVEVDGVLDTYGGAVLRGCPTDFAKHGVFGIGDAIASVKSISCGGLYPISVMSKAYGENIHRAEAVRKTLDGLVKELKRQNVLYRLLNTFLWSWTPRLPVKRVLVEVKEEHLYDNHVNLIARAAVGLRLR